MQVEGHLSQAEERGAGANAQEKTVSFRDTFVNLGFIDLRLPNSWISSTHSLFQPRSIVWAAAEKFIHLLGFQAVWKLWQVRCSAQAALRAGCIQPGGNHKTAGTLIVRPTLLESIIFIVHM